MGVFHMAIPFSPLPGLCTEREPKRLTRNPHGEQAARRERTHAAGEPLPQSVPPITLAANTSKPEGRLADLPRSASLRTPEPDAEQAALQALVQQCLAGDQRAWNQLVSSQHRKVYGLCYRFTGDATEAEDVTQDVFIKVYRNLSSFDMQKGSFQTWIATLTRNLLVDTYRRAKMDRSTESLDVSFSGEDDGPTRAERLADTRPAQNQERHVAGLELKARVQHALKKLSPELREAVILRDLEDMDYKDIALVLKIPEGTVKSRISRGRGELARLLQNLEGQVM